MEQLPDPSGQHVVIGISGGVDSSVAAHLLIERGYRVTGLFMKNWEEDDTDTYCSAERDLADAQAICDRLAIPLMSVNFAHEYWERVFSRFLDEYRAGKTPNPDVLCNREIKFREFLDFALELGADLIATGHYARLLRGERTHLLKGIDRNKDQTYFLHTLGQAALSRSLFPIGAMEKSAVRNLARKLHLETSEKRDSTGICFIGERKFSEFLARFIPPEPGELVTPDGRVVGTHPGVMYFTRGQRQGLGIGGEGAPWYVANKEVSTNQITVVQGHEHPDLLDTRLVAGELNWVSGEPPDLPLRCDAKTRYRQQEQPCTVTEREGGVEVLFERPQWAITPGQSVVFYREDECLGGGVIQNYS